jgi:hypothetical protein
MQTTKLVYLGTEQTFVPRGGKAWCDASLVELFEAKGWQPWRPCVRRTRRAVSVNSSPRKRTRPNCSTL